MYHGKIERGYTDRQTDTEREREREREKERGREGLNLRWKVLESQTETVRQRERAYICVENCF